MDQIIIFEELKNAVNRHRQEVVAQLITAIVPDLVS